MIKHLMVYPSSRSIRDALHHRKDGFLPAYMSMGDFLERVVHSDGKIIPDDDLRLLALHEASEFSAFEGLKIDRNFFTFIQNSSYIFRFFEELSGEMVSIEALELSDIYGEYEEHISILKRLWKRYKEIVDGYGWADPIFSKSTVVLYEEYVAQFETIVVHVEGYLSRYELAVLLASSCVSTVECIYHATLYNEKMSARFRECSLDIEAGYTYRLNLTTGKIVEKIALKPLVNLRCDVFQNRITQIGFIKGEIQTMIESGIEAEKIVVVVPDEAFVEYLRAFNEEHNLNFAMGRSLGSERAILDIEAIELAIKEQSVENKARLERVSTELNVWIKERYYKPFVYEDLRGLCALIAEIITREEVKEIVQEELEKFKFIAEALSAHEFKSALRIFLTRLKKRSLDDVGGGKITVMGLLETRGMSFDGVIVVDFNEGSVPHRSQKDLFLNTTTRRIADLPTSYERESLQKHYYWMLFQRAQRVAISCVHNNETIPSRFLLQLGIPTALSKIDYGSLLLRNTLAEPMVERPFEGRFDFTMQPLSASSLKSFLSCKRQFYYKYIEKIKEHEQPQDLGRERDIGNVLHAAMEKLYLSQETYCSAAEIKISLEKILNENKQRDVMERYTQNLWLEKLEPFYTNEYERFREGIRVAYHEKNAQCLVEGITLIGRIDRIDVNNGGLEILDYKTGSYPDTKSEPKEGESDYQLAIYALLAQEFGDVRRCGYYDLKSGTVEYEHYLDEKISKLREILTSLREQTQWVWEQCDELKHCRYCTYATLCGREL